MLITKSYTFATGATIVAAEQNENFDTIYNDYNGNITNANLAANANIVDTKLAQLTTASKVSTAAITGTLTAANIDTASFATIVGGMNVNIKSLTGMTTALSIAQGGTAATTSAGAYTNIVTHKAYDSGWVAWAAGTTNTFTHNLATTFVVYNARTAENADGTGWQGELSRTTAGTYGGSVCAMTTSIICTEYRTSINVDDGTTNQNVSSGYVRVTMLALE